MVQTITGRGYLHTTFDNYASTAAALANFRAIHALAYPGGTGNEGQQYVLTLYDQKYLDLGADPTGVNDSTAAILHLIEDCNTLRVQGLIPFGIWQYDPAITPVILGGAGLIAYKTNAKVDFDNDYADNLLARGAVIKKPYSVNRLVPLFAVHGGGAVIDGLTVWYSDDVPRLIAGATTIDTASYPTLGGTGPDVYAPAVISDHVHDDEGNALAVGSGTNCGGSIVNITVLGGKGCCVFLGDPDPRDEPWTEFGGTRSWSSGLSKGIAGFDVKLQGFWMGRGVHIERNGNTSSVTILATPGMWTEASQLGVIAARPWAQEQPHIKYAQRNAVCLSAKRKLVGCDIDIKARQMRYACDFTAGDAMARNITAVTRGADTTFTTAIPHGLSVGSKAWIADVGGVDSMFDTGAAYTVTAVPTTTTFTIADDSSAASAYTSGGTASMPCGPQGQDSGKFAALKMSLRGESIPTAVRLSESAYAARLSVTISGHWMDPDDNNCTDPVFDVLTHRDRAGRVRKSTGVWSSMVQMSASFGWFNSITTDPGIQETAGPLFQNTANDGHGFWDIFNKLVFRWCQGDNTQALVINLSPDTTITINGGKALGHSSGSKRLVDTPDASVGDGQILFIDNLKTYGCPNANLIMVDGVSLGTEWTGFDTASWSDPDREIDIDDDDDEDGAGGSGSTGGGEPEE